jgi:Domain of unknown function (DUF4157)
VRRPELVVDHPRAVTSAAIDVPGGASGTRIRRAPDAGQPNRTGLPDSLKSGLEGISGIDLSDVRVAYDSPRPATLNALAATEGSRIHLAPGQERHLAHEAWHVVQQKQGRVGVTATDRGESFNDDRALEREADTMGVLAQRSPGPVGELLRAPPAAAGAPIQRRIPAIAELEELIETITGDLSDPWTITVRTPADAPVHAAALRTVLRRQVEDIRMAEGANDSGPTMLAVRFHRPTFPTIDDTIAGGATSELLELAKLMLKTKTELTLKPPEGYMAPPSTLTEQNNIRTLVDEASKVFDLVAAGSKDAVLTEVFGGGNVVAAKKKVADAKTALVKLFNESKIVTDRTGYSNEVNLGGMSAFGVNILLPIAAVDAPTAPHSIATTFHEALHAGNGDVKDDGGYVGSPGFKLRPEPLKLQNAAHFEVIALRHLLGANDVWDGVFAPPGTVIGGSSGPVAAPTPTEKALHRVSEMFRRSWTAALWLHDDLLNVYKTPSLWGTIKFGTFTYGQYLSYWSNLLGLTVHLRTGLIDAASATKATKPVTQLDMSLFESVTRRLSQLMSSVPKTEGDVYKIHAVYPGGNPLTFVFLAPPAEAEAVATYFLGRAKISGDPTRDLQMVDALCAYFANATGSPLLPNQVARSDIPK